MVRRAPQVRRPQRPPRQLPNTITEEQRKTAWAAVSKMQSMLPQLKAFAKIVTGNPKINIKITSGVPHTSGNTILISPPLGLGKEYAHTRSVCGKRDDDGHQLCKACDVREVIEFYLFHEIAHVAFDSSPRTSYEDRKLAYRYIDQWHPDDECNHGRDLRAAVDDMNRAPNPQNVGGVLNEYLPMIFNCLEDARVNQRTFEARPGLRTVFDLNIDRLMTEGTETVSGHYITWKEANRDSQFMIGLNLLAAGHPVTDDRLAPSVVEALGDEQLNDLCARAIEAENAHEILALSMEVFTYAQTLGYCVVEKCKTDQKDDESIPGIGGCSSDDSSSSGGDDGSDGEQAEGDRTDSGGSERGSDSGESGSDNSGSGGDGNPDGSEQQPEDSSGKSDDGHGGASDSEEEEAGGGTSGADEAPHPGTPGLGDGTPGDRAEHETSAGSSPSTDDGESDGSSDETERTQGDRSDDKGERSDEQDATVNEDGSVREDIGSGDSGDSDGQPGQDAGDSVGTEPEGTGQLDESKPSEDDPETEGQVQDGDSGDDSDVEEPADELDDHDEPRDPWETAAPDVAERPFEAPSVNVDDQTEPALESGTPEDVAHDLARFLIHGYDGQPGLLDGLTDEDIADILGCPPDEMESLSPELERLIGIAIQQFSFFDDPSMEVAGVSTVPYPHIGVRWYGPDDSRFESPEEFKVSDHLIGKALMEARRVFNDNRQARNERGLKSGRVDPRMLGRRAPADDPRMFRKRTVPGKKSYFVVIGADCSGSTIEHDRNPKIKRAVMAQGDLLSRLGIEWAGYGHTAHKAPIETWNEWDYSKSFYLWMLPFKEANEAWNDKTKSKLANIAPIAENLDGHTLQFYRKVAEKHQATNKIIIYYTDGEMPAANATEEREILEREIQICKRLGITLLGVGINTDSPKYYGMDTVRIDSDADLMKVVKQLGNRLTKD